MIPQTKMDEIINAEKIAPARGCMWGLIFSLPLCAILALIVVLITR